MNNQSTNSPFNKIMDNKHFEFLHVNHILFVGLMIAMTVLWLISHLDLNQTQMLPGMTEARGFIVNFQSPVEVKKILVQSGQVVAKGDLLFELSQSDLSAREFENNAEVKQTVVELNIHNATKMGTEAWLKALNKKKTSQMSPLEMRFMALHKAKLAIANEKEKLKVVSPIDGYASELLVSVGETIAPYRTLIEIFHEKPSIVKSYIPESYDLTELRRNRKSIIKSFSRDYQVQGNVVSIGSILTELPQRFQLDPSQKIYGREVKIALPSDNGFYLGEKVMVSLQDL